MDKKKFFALALAVLLSATVAVGCADTGSVPSNGSEQVDSKETDTKEDTKDNDKEDEESEDEDVKEESKDKDEEDEESEDEDAKEESNDRDEENEESDAEDAKEESNDRDEENEESDAEDVKEESKDEDEEYTILYNGYLWKYDDDEVMFTINDRPVTFDMFRYYTMYNKYSIDGGDDTFWTEENQAWYFDLIKDEIKYCYSQELLADKLGITFTDQDKLFVQEHIENVRTQVNSEGITTYDEALEKLFFTDKVYTELVTFDYYSQKIFESITVTEDELEDYIESCDYVNAQHILVDTEEQALEILELIENAEMSFEDAAIEYSTCSSASSGGHLGEFTRGKMVAEFENAVYAMEIGEISEPVKSQFGYHIIKRIPVNIEKGSQVWSEAEYMLINDKYSTGITEIMDSLVVEDTEAFKELTMQNIGILIETEETESDAIAEETAEEGEAAEAAEGEAAEAEETTEAAEGEAAEAEETTEAVEGEAAEAEETAETTEAVEEVAESEAIPDAEA